MNTKFNLFIIILFTWITPAIGQSIYTIHSTATINRSYGAINSSSAALNRSYGTINSDPVALNRNSAALTPFRSTSILLPQQNMMAATDDNLLTLSQPPARKFSWDDEEDPNDNPIGTVTDPVPLSDVPPLLFLLLSIIYTLCKIYKRKYATLYHKYEIK